MTYQADQAFVLVTSQAGGLTAVFDNGEADAIRHTYVRIECSNVQTKEEFLRNLGLHSCS